ncbi:CPBP family glutamic-type intramembrane protease [Paenibacillus sp. CAU 1782]
MKAQSTRNLVVFAAVVIASGWIGVLVDSTLEGQQEGNTLGMGIWLVLPLLTVIVLRSFAGDGWKGAGLAPLIRSGWPWYLVALLVYPLVTSIVLLAGYVTGWIDFSNLRLGALGGVFIGLLLIQFVKNIFEEAVWRGYLTAKLMQLGVGDWALYGIAGLIWGIWHVPYYLHFLPDEMMHTVLPVNKILFAMIAVISMIAWSVLFVELYRIAGSIWPGVLMHAVEDSLLNPLVIDGYITVAAGKEIWVSPITGILPTVLYVAAGLIIRSIRLRRLA